MRAATPAPPDWLLSDLIETSLTGAIQEGETEEADQVEQLLERANSGDDCTAEEYASAHME